MENSKVEDTGEEEHEEQTEGNEEWGPPEYYSSSVNVDDVLKELVERKSKLQSFTPFNLDYAVDDLNHEYKRAVDSNTKLRSSRRELRDEDVSTGLDAYSRKVESRMKGLVEHSNEESQAAVTKFDELMKRLKKTVAAHKQEIISTSTRESVSNVISQSDK